MAVKVTKNKDDTTTYSKTVSLPYKDTDLMNMVVDFKDYSNIFSWCKEGGVNEEYFALIAEKFGQKTRLDGHISGRTKIGNTRDIELSFDEPVDWIKCNWKFEKKGENETEVTFALHQKPFENFLERAAFKVGSAVVGFSFENEVAQMVDDVAKAAAKKYAVKSNPSQTASKANTPTQSVNTEPKTAKPITHPATQPVAALKAQQVQPAQPATKPITPTTTAVASQTPQKAVDKGSTGAKQGSKVGQTLAAYERTIQQQQQNSVNQPSSTSKTDPNKKFKK